MWSVTTRLYCKYGDQAFKRQSHKMIKQVQTIHRQKLTNCLTVFDHFWELSPKELTYLTKDIFHLVVPSVHLKVTHTVGLSPSRKVAGSIGFK